MWVPLSISETPDVHPPENGDTSQLEQIGSFDSAPRTEGIDGAIKTADCSDGDLYRQYWIAEQTFYA